MKIYRVEYSRTYNTKYSTVEAKSKSDAITKAIEDNNWIEYPILSLNPTYNYVANEVRKKIAKDYKGWNIPNVGYWLPFANTKDK